MTVCVLVILSIEVTQAASVMWACHRDCTCCCKSMKGILSTGMSWGSDWINGTEPKMTQRVRLGAQ